MECYRCGRRGHIARECRTKIVHKSKHSAKQAERSSSERQEYTTMFSTTEEARISEQSNSVWCIDSGCTGHMCNDKHMIKGFTRLDNELNLANHESTQITGMGQVSISVDTGCEKRLVDIQKVFYVPDLRTSLLSVSKMTDHGYEVHFTKQDAVVTDKNKKVHIRADRVGNLYHVRLGQQYSNNVQMVKKPIDMWHERLGHINERDLKAMVKNNLVHGLKFDDSEKLSDCETCLSQKMTCKPFPKSSEERTNSLLEIVHTDVCGPMRHESYGKKKYFVTFIDDKSRWCEVYFIANKNDVFKVFQEYKAYVEKMTGLKIKNLQSDNGREYINTEFDEFLKKEGIRRRLTVPYTPQQNGVAERKNRTLIEMARCMMHQARCPPGFWAEAINTANFIRNRCPTVALRGEIPYTVWKGKKPTLIYMNTFGAKLYYKEKGSKKGKFDANSEVGIFMGYDDKSKAYRIHDPKTKKIIIARDVNFMKASAFNNQYEEILESDNEEKESINIDLNKEHQSKEKAKEDRPYIKAIKTESRMRRSLENIQDNLETESTDRLTRKRHSTVLWERLIEPAKRERGRPRLIRTGLVGRPRKEYQYQESNEKVTEGETDDEESEGQMSASMVTIDPMTWQEAERMPADVLTKGLGATKHHECLGNLGMIDKSD